MPRLTFLPARRKLPLIRRLSAKKRRGAMFAGALCLAGAAIWSVAAGHADDAMASARVGALQLTATMGFSVQEVVVRGRQVTWRDQIWDALEIERGDPILDFDVQAARERLEALPWVRSARVERRLPDALHLTIEERAPVALWQRDGRLHLIDAGGAVLAREGLEAFADLLLVVGEGAELRAAEIDALLAERPAVAARVNAAIWVGGRRWDLRLDNGVTVRLPESDVSHALANLETYTAEHGLLDRAIVSIDLRLADRVIIRTSPVIADALAQSEEST